MDSTGVAMGTVGNPLQIAGAGGGGVSAVDESAWTAGASAFGPSGGVFNDTAAALTTGQQGTQRLTPNRAGHVNLRNQAGTEIGTASAPLSAILTTGAAVIGAVTQSGTWNVTVNAALPAGANSIGTVVLGAGAAAVGTVGVTSLPAIPTGANVIGAVTQSGTWNVTVNAALPAGGNTIGAVTGSGNFSVLGTKTNNNAAPGATNIGALPAVANAAAPTWTEGNLVLASVDLSGNQRTIVTSALPAGSNVIGAVTQSGTWNVTVNAALPTGANVIGAVTQSGTWNVTVNTALPTGTNSIGTVVQGAAGAAGWLVVGPQASGAAVATNPIIVAGIDGSNVRYLLTDTSGRSQVVGAAATGAALAGNPVRVGISDATNAQDWRQMVFTTGNAATGYPGVALLSSNGTTLDPVKNDGGGANASLRVNIASGGSSAGVGALADGNSQAGLKVYAAMMGYNGTNNDNLRNNTTNVVQASTLTTVQTINTDIVNYNGRAFMAHANVTVYNAGSILMKLQIKDANGLFVDIPGATTGTVTSGADVLLNVGPTVWPANTATMFNVNFFLPRNIRLVTTIASASVTFSQSYDLPAN